MGSFSTATRNGWLTSTVSDDVWVQFHLGDPGTSGTANPAVNVQRKLVTWGAVAAGAVSNSAGLTWTNVPATETYTDVSLWTAPSGGTFIGRDTLAAPIAVTAGDPAVIAIGELTLAIA